MAKFRDIAETAMKESGDFAAGLFHSAFENPINGVTQIANRTGLTDIPELHLVRGDNTSVGGILGNIAGGVADFYVLNKVGGKLMGNLGGEGIGGAMLRAGIVGGVYEGVFTPSDANSKNFWRDRAAGAGVGFTTFAAMAGAGGLIDKTGFFAVPEGRSLMGSITYGGTSGALGGLAHAEANAIFREGKPIASWQEFRNDALSYAAFGAAFGALGWGENRIDQKMNDRSVSLQVKDHRGVKVEMDRNGTPFRITEERPASQSWPDMFVRNTSVKMTNGSWSSSSKGFDIESGKAQSWMPTWKFTTEDVSVKPGAIKVTDTDGRVRSYTDKGYTNRYADATPAPSDFDYVPPDWGTRKLADGTRVQLDLKNGSRFQDFRTPDGKHGAIYYKDGGSDVSTITMGNGKTHISFMPKEGADGHWNLYMDNKLYDFKGKISVVGGEGITPKFTVTADGGKPVTFSPGESFEPVLNLAKGASTFVPGGTGLAYGEVNAKGELTVHQASKYDRVMEVNGKPVTGDRFTVKPGETITFRVDVGDRYPVWENHVATWGLGPNGQITLNGNEIKPGALFDIVPKPMDARN